MQSTCCCRAPLRLAIWGGASSAALGASFHAGRPGDHNADGLGDLIIGADGASSGVGAAYLMRTPFVKSKEATFATAMEPSHRIEVRLTNTYSASQNTVINVRMRVP